MSTVVNNFIFLLFSLKTSIKSASEYKASFILNTIFMMINNSIFLAGWYVIFKNTGSVEAVNFEKMLKLWSISTISYGITYFLFGGVSYINRYIIDCELDIYLTKPKNILISILTSKCRFSACGDMIFGIITAIIVSKSISEFMWLACFGIFGMVFLLSLEIIFRSICVFIGDTEVLTSRLVMNVFISLSTYPIDILSTSLKIVIFTVIPTYYAVHLPLQIIENFSVSKLAIVILAGIFFLILSIFVFYKSIKRYESGNSISLRM